MSKKTRLKFHLRNEEFLNANKQLADNPSVGCQKIHTEQNFAKIFRKETCVP